MKKLILLLLIATGLFAQSESGGYYIPSKWKLSGSNIEPANSGWTVKFPTPFTLGSTSVTTTGTQLNYLNGATGTTGTNTTNLVFSTSPVLVTPTLGVAQGTSLALGGATISTHALAVNGTIYGSGAATFTGINTANSTPLTLGNAYAGNNVQLAINGVANKAIRIVLQESGVDKWLIGSGAANENGNFEIYNAAGVVSLSIDKTSNNATFAGSILAAAGSAASPSISFSGDTNTGLYSVGADQLGIAVNGTNAVTVTTTGVGIGTTTPLALLHTQGTAMFGAGTGASLTDSSLVINYTTGSPRVNFYGVDGDTYNLGINTDDGALFSGATTYNFDNDIVLPEAGSSINSKAIKLQADNATTTQEGSIQVMYGADPYLRFSAPNDAGTATAIMDLKDQRVVIGAGTDAVDYDIFMNGFSNQGSITYMEDEDRFDFDNDVKVGASLWGSAVMSGTNAFTTTATADTVAVTGATVNDIYMLTYITAVTAAEAPLSVTATATGFIATRPAGVTSDAAYAWTRQRK